MSHSAERCGAAATISLQKGLSRRSAFDIPGFGSPHESASPGPQGVRRLLESQKAPSVLPFAGTLPKRAGLSHMPIAIEMACGDVAERLKAAVC